MKILFLALIAFSLDLHAGVFTNDNVEWQNDSSVHASVYGMAMTISLAVLDAQSAVPEGYKIIHDKKPHIYCVRGYAEDNSCYGPKVFVYPLRRE